MTLPTLIQKYQNLVLETQLKKTYSTLSQGIQKAMADEGVTSFYDTELFNTCVNVYMAHVNPEYCKQTVKKYFKVNTPVSLEYKEYYQKLIRPIQEYRTISYKRDNEYKSKGQSSFYLYSLADGAQFTFNCNLGWNMGCEIFTDVNGNKGPNTRNLDIFYFKVDDKKILGTYDYIDGIYAAGSKAVMENGWKFPW